MESFHLLDWIAIGGYLALALGVGTLLARRASRSTQDFYLANRTLPWWVAGTSMVATSFAADTPLVVTGWVRERGIAGNWIWWGMAVGGVLSFVLLAAYWRRLEVTTDAGLIEHRYHGAPARVLRALYGGYHALVTNTIVLTWVLVAMIKVVKVVLDLPADRNYDVYIVVGSVAFALLYSLLAGLWGVTFTDLFQFVLAVFGAVILAWKAIESAGGLDPARELIAQVAGTRTDLVPSAGDGGWLSISFWTQGFTAFLVLVGVQGWLNKNADGNGIAVQRFSACRSEGHARGAALWFHLTHYCLRPWPWILVALMSLVFFETAELPLKADGTPDHELAYPMMMAELLGPGLFGLMCASFLAAFMSTLDTHLNLASAYMVNDLYRRFVRKNESERHYVWTGRGVEILIGALAGYFALSADSISKLFELSLSLLGGLGPALLIRWFWWRANPWTEFSALLASTGTTLLLQTYGEKIAWPAAPFNGWVSGAEWDFSGQYLIVIAVSILVMVIVTLLTPPVPMDHLRRFHEKVRPVGAWGPVRMHLKVGLHRGAGRAALIGWFGSVALIFGLMLGSGALLLGQSWTHYGVAALVGLVLLSWSWGRSVPPAGHEALKRENPE